ncbi:pirin family protein [Corallococcus sp. M34]|uniref:pirin family protein n=1 Tax=Citreicoccus inhibens TaxID=2849499 RepID=UPI001C24E074|nr:pirin family protein [Citreicoccus inhibens]MBU8900826.1 pirin family protein [Citreicoccus inhibens]
MVGVQEAPDVELILAAKSADLPGGIHVLRALPQAQRRMVGPFVFLDQMGPTSLHADVLAHPHIGLSTVTYLFEGEILHKDSLGSEQWIRPGAVNWMTAGSGIVHAERAPTRKPDNGRLYGIQIWVALPRADEETAPSFVHHAAESLPTVEDAGVRVRLVAGSMFGLQSPVRTHSELFYADVALEAGAVLKLPALHDERAAYVAEGSVSLTTGTLGAGNLALFRRGTEVLLQATEDSRVLVFGGEPLDGPRHIFWNFVSSSKDRIEEAKRAWKEQRMGKVPGESEFISL